MKLPCKDMIDGEQEAVDCREHAVKTERKLPPHCSSAIFVIEKPLKIISLPFCSYVPSLMLFLNVCPAKVLLFKNVSTTSIFEDAGANMGVFVFLSYTSISFHDPSVSLDCMVFF